MPIGLRNTTTRNERKKRILRWIRNIVFIVIAILAYEYRNEIKAKVSNNFKDIPSFINTEMTEEEKLEYNKALTNWYENEKPGYIERVKQLRSVIENRKQSGYRWNYKYEKNANKAIDKLDNAILEDNFKNAHNLLLYAEESVITFEKGCIWTEGLRHGVYSHVYSTSVEGEWRAESGWVFIEPTKSLEVARICSKCDGNGQVLDKVECQNCCGVGMVPGTLSPVLGFLGDVVQVLEAVDNIDRGLKGEKLKKMSRRDLEDKGYVNCQACNGKKTVRDYVCCPRCDGKGWNN